MTLLLSLACSDYNLFGFRDEVTPGENDPDAEAVEDPDEVPLIEDCEELEVGESGPVDADCALEAAPPQRPWDMEVVWAWEGLSDNPDANDIWVTPAVGDLDGDGIPEVVFSACQYKPTAFGTCWPAPVVDGVTFVHYEATLVVVDGATGDVKLEFFGVDMMGQIALGDADGDGDVEILTMDPEGFPMLLNIHGEIEWKAPSRASNVPWRSCLDLVDLDGDGVAEVLTETSAWSLLTGDWMFAIPDVIGSRTCTAGDFNLDGQTDWVVGDEVWGVDGLQWELDWQSGRTGWTMPVQVDDDPEAELALSGEGGVYVFDDDGTKLHHHALADGFDDFGPPCAGDFDGDGDVEMAVPARTELIVFELRDFGVAWSRPIDDWTGASGCSGFDFDGDGALEILHADHDELRVWTGDGTQVVSELGRASGTGFDVPVIADVNLDGAADLVLSNSHIPEYNDGWDGLRVLRNVDNTWPPAGPSWGSNDFRVTDRNPDLTVPASPDPSWEHNVYRARPAADPLGDLRVQLMEACVSTCDSDGEVALSVQVSNQGSLSVHGARLTLSRVQDGQEEVLRTVALDSLDPMQAAEGVVFDNLKVMHLGDELVVRVEHDREDCELSDQEVVWTNPCL